MGRLGDDEPQQPQTSAREGGAMPPISGTGPAHALARALESELRALDGGRLSSISWFRTDWQRGGAATATARHRDADGIERDAVVKVPVTERERRWFERLGRTEDAPVARLFASGDSLGPYDFAWIVIERLPFGPLAARWHERHMARIGDAAARFHRDAAAHPIEAVAEEPWDELLGKAREAVKEPSFPERSRWHAALKECAKKADRAIAIWRERTPLGWIHGDLHPANAMSRVGEEDGPACLIDLGEVRSGHWLEDAVYLERIHWTRPERLAAKPVKCVADARKVHGLENGDWPLAASARRVLLAATAPSFRGEQSPPVLAASLLRLEQGLKEIR